MIKGFTFRLVPSKLQTFAGEETKSLRLLKDSTATDTAVIAIIALQDTAHSEDIDLQAHMPKE